MKKRLCLVLVLVLAFTLCLAGCGNNAGSDVKSADLDFATGGTGGTYYAYGVVLSEYVSNNCDNITITGLPGNGSQANVEDLDAGDVQMAFCQSDVMSYAYQGSNLFNSKVDSFSILAGLYMEDVQIVTCDPSIKTVADLKGKTVSVGAQGSGVYFNALDILKAYDLTLNDITPVYQGFSDSTESLKDNKIDAALVVAGAPTNSITELCTAKQAYLVSLDDEHINKLIAMSPYYSKHVIPAATYGTDADATTVAVAAMVIVRDDVDEDVVYNITKTIFDGKSSIEHAKANDLDVNFATEVTSVPYHKGAAKYYAEKGVTVATK